MHEQQESAGTSLQEIQTLREHAWSKSSHSCGTSVGSYKKLSHPFPHAHHPGIVPHQPSFCLGLAVYFSAFNDRLRGMGQAAPCHCHFQALLQQLRWSTNFRSLRLLDLTVSQSSVGVKISGVALLSLKHEKGCCSSMRLHPCGSLLLPKIR